MEYLIIGVSLMYIAQGIYSLSVRLGYQRPDKKMAWACVVASSLGILVFGYVGITTIIIATTVMGKVLWGTIMFICLVGFPLRMLTLSIKWVGLAKEAQANVIKNSN